MGACGVGLGGREGFVGWFGEWGGAEVGGGMRLRVSACFAARRRLLLRVGERGSVRGDGGWGRSRYLLLLFGVERGWLCVSSACGLGIAVRRRCGEESVGEGGVGADEGGVLAVRLVLGIVGALMDGSCMECGFGGTTVSAYRVPCRYVGRVVD